MSLLHHRFEAVARERPEALAIDDGVETLTYAQLDARANALAVQLVAKGVSPGDRVALCVGRSCAIAIGVIGIWKAGAAYVPLDAEYPLERLRMMLADAAPRCVVTQPELTVAKALASDAMPLVCIQPDVAASAPSVALPEDGSALAYVIFTSGSTGRPKGVMVEHRNAIAFCAQMEALVFGALPADARIGLNAAISFDASVQALGQLLYGRTLVPVPQQVRVDGAAMCEFIRNATLDALDCTPSQLQSMVAGGLLERSTLRLLLVGGEAFPPLLWKRMAESSIPTFNCYGPTECTVNSTMAPVRGETPCLGDPLPGVWLELRDANGGPARDGEEGTLWIGGSQVTRGYLGLDAQTSARFQLLPAGRAYDSGDLCRRDEAGRLLYLGRADTQVKLRGHRMELQDIEACMAACPGVREVVVGVRGEAGDEQLVGYIVPEGQMPSHADLSSFALAHLPGAMVPTAWVAMKTIPLTPSGKCDRKALPDPDTQRPEIRTAFVAATDSRERQVCDVFASVLNIDVVGRDDHFFELGGNSLRATTAVARLQGVLPGLRVIDLFESPTASRLVARGLGRDAKPEVRQSEGRADPVEPIAIIGMAGRFPGASDVEQYWQNLLQGVESITRFDRLDPSIPAELSASPGYVRARGRMPDAEWFDAEFFGITAREAQLMDPQQRIFLELCWECMERAGQVPGSRNARVGVFAGVNNPTYLYRHLLATPGLAETAGEYQVMVGNEKDYIASRVAHKLNLHGPAISVHTACSTSLVAICQAVQALRAGICDAALAGGSSVVCPVDSGYVHVEGGMLSPDGSTRPFDAEAAGTVFGDGAGVILLKRLSDALRDGNPVHALIRGVGLNNDGGDKASFTAPSTEWQAAVIAMAHRDAAITSDDIGYVEAHGTATPLGDPIEIEGLTRAFRVSGQAVGHCLIGSAKSNIGHGVTSAGVAGLIKAVNIVKTGDIPATLHFRAANPAIAFAGSPFVVAATRQSWAHPGPRRLAGVSSFGVGGTNAHVVIESAPPSASSDPLASPVLLCLSAKTRQTLPIMARNLGNALAEADPDALADVAWTLATGRKAFPERIALVATDLPEAIAKLGLTAGVGNSATPRVPPAHQAAFLFTGQGAQYPQMGLALAERFPAFDAALRECAELLQRDSGIDLLACLRATDPEVLLPTSVMQPATFAFEYAMARLWAAAGVQPAAMLGHSLGEFVAATLAGVFSLADALRIVARRGQWMQAMPPGGMLSVRLPASEVAPLLSGGLGIAAENGPRLTVVSGPLAELNALTARLDKDEVPHRMLQTSHAFHSTMMEPVVASLREMIAGIALHAPAIPMVSSVTGQWLQDEATSADYWARQAVAPVRFADAIATLAAGNPCMVEIGPRQSLTAIARSQLPMAKTHLLASGGDEVDNEVAHWLQALGQAWCAGLDVDIAFPDQRKHRSFQMLPTYPFQRSRHWIEAPTAADRQSDAVATQPVATADVVTVSQHNEDSNMSEPVDRLPDAQTADLIRGMIAQVSGNSASEIPGDVSFIDQGLDSLVLTQLAAQLQRKFNQRISFRQLMSDLGSVDALAMHLKPVAPAAAAPAPMAPAAPQQVVQVVPQSLPAASTSINTQPQARMQAAEGGGAIAALLQEQMAVMQRQIALLGELAGVGGQAQPTPVLTTAPAVPSPQPPAAVAAATASPAQSAAAAGSQPSQIKYDVKNAFGAIARIHKAKDSVGPQQKQHLETLIKRYNARTPKSKAYNQQYRGCMADPRVVSGFRPLFKEIVYQTVMEQSNGCRLRDIDGNDYIDANNGFGMSLFGWQPSFVVDAVRAQLERGYEIGPQTPLVGETAALMCELTGHERAAFCNTGSEAVLGAIRVARTATGRDTLVVFSGSYHGINDEVIIRANQQHGAVPGAPGILQAACANVVVLDYGKPESLEYLRGIIGDVAAVLVEPVQSRNPDLQPAEFLRELRELTTQGGAVLIFDEIITGFRSHLGGTQALFGVRADLATYGKVIGGGFPIGAICGKREFMDVLDGGDWRFGDDSEPVVGVTYFAGTFVRHPLAVAATHAALTHLKAQGPALQEGLNARTKAFVARLNAYCEKRGAPIRIASFASLWRVRWLEEHLLQDLLYPMMRLRGIHILDNFPCYFTTAHTQSDIDAIAIAFEQSVDELQQSGFVPVVNAQAAQAESASLPPEPGARLGRDQDGKPAWFVRETDGALRKVG